RSVELDARCGRYAQSFLPKALSGLSRVSRATEARRMTHPPVVVESPITETPWIGPKGQRMERLELHLTYTCPERCVFCSEEHRMQEYRRYPASWARVATVLRTDASRGVTNVHLTGGEPTIHPDFIDVLVLAKKLGMRTS